MIGAQELSHEQRQDHLDGDGAAAPYRKSGDERQPRDLATDLRHHARESGR